MIGIFAELERFQSSSNCYIECYINTSSMCKAISVSIHNQFYIDWSKLEIKVSSAISDVSILIQFY